MALESNDRNELVIIIDLETCIVNNDMEEAQRVTEFINSTELTADAINTIDGIIYSRLHNEVGQKDDLFRYLISNINCIDDKKMRLYEIDMINLKKDGSKAEIERWLDNFNYDELDFTTYKFSKVMVRLFIVLASRANRYDIMTKIKNKLMEIK